MLNLIFALLLFGNAKAASPPNGSLNILDDLLEGNFDLSETQQSFRTKLYYQSHSLRAGILLRNAPTRSNTFLHANYSYNLKISGFLNYEASLGIGSLNSSFPRSQNFWFIEETLFGARNYFHLALGTKNKEHTKFGIGAGAVKKDNWFLEAYLQNYIQGFFSDFRINRKFFNEGRYWFVKQRNSLAYKAGPQFSLGNFQFLPFGGLDFGSNGQEKYRDLLHGGLIIDLKTASKKLWRCEFQYGIDRPQKTEISVFSLGSDIKPSKNIVGGAWEIFGQKRKQESVYGFKLTLKSMNSHKEDDRRPKLFSPENYRDVAKQSDFYGDFGYQDSSNLNIYEQADRLKSLRKRNEWSGKNLFQTSYGGPLRLPATVYASRDGDCDDQSMLNAWIDRRNGYRPYVLSYFPDKTYSGHAVEIVQDPKTGRWFMDEYGILQEIKVAANAPLQQVMEEALRQGAKFAVLPIYEPWLWYWVDEPANDPVEINHILRGEITNFQSTAGSMPRLERGYELFAGPDALWK